MTWRKRFEKEKPLTYEEICRAFEKVPTAWFSNCYATTFWDYFDGESIHTGANRK
jgi:hypothetical protein